MDAALGQAVLNEQWVQFSGVSFGVAPADHWPELQHSLLEVEHCLAVRQHDVGYVGEYPFDPAVPTGVRVMPCAFPHDPDQWAWLHCEMQLMCDHGVLERSDNIECAGGVVLVKG